MALKWTQLQQHRLSSSMTRGSSCLTRRTWLQHCPCLLRQLCWCLRAQALAARRGSSRLSAWTVLPEVSLALDIKPAARWAACMACCARHLCHSCCHLQACKKQHALLSAGKEAEAVYSTIKTHPDAEIAKLAKRMLAGFKAMQFLKAEQVSYAQDPAAYRQFFDRFQSDWGATYVSTDEDDSSLNLTTAIATAIMLAPFVFLGFKVVPRFL